MMRCPLFRRRLQMASARVGSPRKSCQWGGASWLAKRRFVQHFVFPSVVVAASADVLVGGSWRRRDLRRREPVEAMLQDRLDSTRRGGTFAHPPPSRDRTRSRRGRRRTVFDSLRIPRHERYPCSGCGLAARMASTRSRVSLAARSTDEKTAVMTCTPTAPFDQSSPFPRVASPPPRRYRPSARCAGCPPALRVRIRPQPSFARFASPLDGAVTRKFKLEIRSDMRPPAHLI